MSKKSIVFLLFVAMMLLSPMFVFADSTANDVENAEAVGVEVKNTEVDNAATKKISDDEISALMNKYIASAKPLEALTVQDILQDEEVSPDLKQRMTNALEEAQYGLDKYRTIISNHSKQVDVKLLEFRNELNTLNSVKDKMEINLSLAKWMVISLAVGIICLTTIVIIMWRSVVNVNRNDVELIYSIEKFKKDIKSLLQRVEMIEKVIKEDDK